MNKDQELLFAVLALQMNFITKEQLVECGALWASEPNKPLSDILMDKGYLNDNKRNALAVMAKAHAEEFGAGDPGASLQSMSIPADVKEPLLGINLGKVGFLAEAETGDIDQAVRDIVAGTYTVDERLTLDVRAEYDGRLIAESWALNEVSVLTEMDKRRLERARA